VVFGEQSDGTYGDDDLLPASYHHYCEAVEKGKKKTKKHRVVADPSENHRHFLETELSLTALDKALKHLWFAGSRRYATQLHLQVVMGRTIVVADPMHLHLLWDNDGRIFVKPVPRFLLDRGFWRRHLKCPDGCECMKGGGEGSLPMPANHHAQQVPSVVVPCSAALRKVALGFLYTYVCLISSESDFLLAVKKRLLPEGGTAGWAAWKKLAREVLAQHDPDKVHPRFLRAELRLSRINTIRRLSCLSGLDPYLYGRHSYSAYIRDNLAWMVITTIFFALVLTAMQVGLATDRLQASAAFQRASYGFTVFAILGPLCAFGLIMLAALVNLLNDLPSLLQDARGVEVCTTGQV
jgi:hypothetical protein